MLVKFSQRWLWRVLTFWNMSFNLVKVNQSCGGTYRLHLQGMLLLPLIASLCFSESQWEQIGSLATSIWAYKILCFSALMLPTSVGFLLGSLLDPEDGCDVPPKRLFTFTSLHGVISQKIKRFAIMLGVLTLLRVITVTYIERVCVSMRLTNHHKWGIDRTP
jgi:hypothetical protein